jgi:hypothetical protein
MNLRKVMFWKQTAATAPAQLADAITAVTREAEPPTQPMRAAADLADKQSAKVIQMPRPETATDLGETPLSDEFVKAPPQPQRVQGLMNSPELEAFFRSNQFGFGRHHGSHYRTQEALDRGLLAVVTSFQNIVADLAERRQARVDKLQQSRQEVATLSPTMAETLRLACEQAQREIAVLKEQHALAEQRKGWVLDALNRYQLGFDRGVREALDFELLNV